MKIRTSTGRNHVWQRTTHRVEVDGREQEAKSCSRCGMERTRDMGTKTLHLFREMGSARWVALNAGVLPVCGREEAKP